VHRSSRSTGVLDTRTTTLTSTQQASRRNQSTPDPTTEITAPTRSATMSPRSNRRKNSIPKFAGPKATGSPPRRLRSGKLGHRLIRNPAAARKIETGRRAASKPEAARKKRAITKAPIRKQGNKRRSKQRGRRGREGRKGESRERAGTDHWARRLARRRRPIGERVVSSAPSSIPASRWLRWGAGRRGSESGQSEHARRRGRVAVDAQPQRLRRDWAGDYCSGLDRWATGASAYCIY